MERAAIPGEAMSPLPEDLLEAFESHRCSVVGVTGTGGSGKSSLTDELLRRIRLDQQDELAVAVLAVDPNRRRSGGALLGDRLRMNAIEGTQVFFRSVGTAIPVPRCRRAFRR